MTTFKDLALEAIGRGLRVCRLKPGDKRPLAPSWLEEASQSKTQVEGWDAENPRMNCGAVVDSSFGYWVVDVDCLDFLMDECPHDCLPVGETSTYTVETGGGGRHYYFAGKGPWDGIKHVRNPDEGRWKKPDGSECKSVIDIICHGGQVLVAGNIHPKTGRPYKVSKDVPMREASPMFVGWLRSVLEPKAKRQQAKAPAGESPIDQGKRGHDNAFEIDPDVDIDRWFEASGLKFEKKVRDGNWFYNYHVMMGRCLVKGELHIGDGGGNEKNNECSAFVYNPRNRQLWHKCHAGACSPEGRQYVDAAIAALGKDPKRLFYKDGRRKAKWHCLGEERGRHVEWMWKLYLASNKLTHFVGASTEGKSPVTLDLAARVSKGDAWPDGSENTMGPMKVVLLAAEDDLHDVIIPRLEVAGADKSMIGVMKASVNKDMTSVEMSVALDQDLKAMEEMVEELGNVALIIIDPVTNYLGKVRMNHEEEVRSILMPLSELCQRQNVCAITVGHINKRNDAADARQRVMGAAAFLGVARQIFFFDADPEDPDKHSHVIVPYRIVAPSLKYKTVTAPWADEGEITDHVKVEWGGVSSATFDDIGKAPSAKDKSKLAEAAKWLRAFLSKQGKTPAADCIEALDQAGFATRKSDSKGGLNEAEIRKRAKVTSAKEGKNWVWFVEEVEQAKAKSVQEGIDFNTEDM